MRMKVEVLTLLSFFVTVGLIYGTPDFSQPKYHLGFTNYEGKMNLWVPLGVLKASDGTEIPFRLHFSSETAAKISPFGHFWSCPVLDSNVFPYSERIITLSTISGQTVYLNKNKLNENEFESGDRRIKAVQVLPTKTVVYDAGWEFRYLKGRLQSVMTASGVELEWNYNGNRVVSISERNKGTIFSIDYATADSLPSGFTINNRRFDLSSQNIPLVTEVMGEFLISSYSPSLSALKSEHDEWKFPIELDKSGFYNMKYERPFGEGSQFVWSASNGILKKDGVYTYEITKRDDAEPLVSRVNGQGERESYVYNAKTGISEHKLLDGTVITRNYFIHRNPSQYKIRRLNRTKNGKLVEEVRWSYDELGREIRMVAGDFEKSTSYHLDGSLASTSEKKKGEILREEKFHPDGKLLEKTKGSFTYKYNYNEFGETIIQQFFKGEVVSAKVLNTKDKTEVFFTADQAKGLLQTGEPLFQKHKTVDPEVVGRARDTVLKILKSTK